MKADFLRFLSTFLAVYCTALAGLFLLAFSALLWDIPEHGLTAILLKSAAQGLFVLIFFMVMDALIWRPGK